MNELYEYREKLEFLLDNWNAELDKLEDSTGKSGADPKADHDGILSALRQNRYNEIPSLKVNKQI